MVQGLGFRCRRCSTLRLVHFFTLEISLNLYFGSTYIEKLAQLWLLKFHALWKHLLEEVEEVFPTETVAYRDICNQSSSKSTLAFPIIVALYRIVMHIIMFLGRSAIPFSGYELNIHIMYIEIFCIVLVHGCMLLIPTQCLFTISVLKYMV